jgi:zinc finger CCHC domain-containing protein 9
MDKIQLAALKRRTRRERKKEHKMNCFLCRQTGHSIKNCPRNQDENICYRCGSSCHILSKCEKQHDSKNPLPFAFCFECKQKGHLIGQCLLNEKGLYPTGGNCEYCGSVRHLKKGFYLA